MREEVQQDPLLETALKLYEKEKENIIKKYVWLDRTAYTFKIQTPALSPTQIALFCQNEEQNEAFSLYLNSLIQKSYKEGNNNFTLAFNTPHDGLLYRVQGTKEQPINITINGNTKDNCAQASEDLNLTINGNTKNNCAENSSHANITINGNTEDFCAYQSKYINLTINGNTGNICAEWSEHAKITINGTIGRDLSHNPTYFTNNPTTYEQLKALGCNVTLQ